MTEYSRLNKNKSQKNFRLFKLFILLLIFGSFTYFFINKLNLFPNVNPSLDSSAASQATLNSSSNTNQTDPLVNANSRSDFKIAPNSPGLSTAIASSLDGTKGTYGLVIKNLSTGESYVQNEHLEFEPGSLYKLWIMAIVFKQIEQGKLHLDDPLIVDVSEVNDKFHIPGDDAEMTAGQVNFTIRSALEQMITISHNYAALGLTDKIGLSSVADFLKTNGFKESTVGIGGNSPQTTPTDVALFFEKLYQGKLGSEASTQQMIELLKRDKLNDLIPKYLPDGVDVAHKIGNIEDFDHDAGIVFTSTGDYIIVAMSKTDSPDLAEERIALLSKAVYQYFNP